MKVLQVTALDFTVTRLLKPLITSLEQQGHEVHTACNVTQEGDHTHHIIDFSRDFNIKKHLKALGQLVRLMKKERYDIVHTHTPIASILARLAAKIAKVPTTIYTAHGFYFHDEMPKLQYQLYYQLEKWWAKLLTDYLFFQSEEDYTLAMENKFKAQQQLVHISNGVDRHQFNKNRYNKLESRHKLHLLPQDFVYIFVGRLVEEKGINELLKAFQQVCQQQPSKLLVVGDFVEGDRQRFHNMIAHEHIQFLGLRHDIPQLLAAADVFVLPSYREGMPRSILEAMAMGKPIIASNIRGCREEVVDGKTGLLCDVKNVESLATKMFQLRTDPTLTKKLAVNSYQRFLAMYDEEKVLSRQQIIYNDIQQRAMQTASIN